MKSSKKLIAFMLVVVFCMSLFAPAMAAAAVAPVVELDTTEVFLGDGAQEVTMVLKNAAAFPVASASMDLVASDGNGNTLVFKSVTSEAFSDVSCQSNKVMAATDDSQNTNATSVITAVVSIDANTPAGTYTIGVSDLELCYDIWNTYDVDTTITATLEVKEGNSGYKATMAADETDVSVGAEINITLGANKAFSATQMTLTYDPALVQYKGISEGYAVNSATAGTLQIAAYGEEKTGPVVTFEALTNGTADFELTDAKFGTGESSETASLELATLPDVLSVTIEEAQHSVTLPDIFTGPTSVVDGGTYTFAPESATGAYYNYGTPTATIDGVAATVVPDGNGWKVENVTGALVITGTRTEKTYSFNAQGQEGEDNVTTSGTPTYGTDFTFTLPAGQAVNGINNGYHYEIVSVTVGGATGIYTYNDNTLTATISGTNVVGDIVVVIEKVIDTAATAKITLSGDVSDVKINGSDNNTVTVVKGSEVTLTIAPEAGYVYTVTVGGVDVTNDILADNEYKFNASADVGVTVTKNLDVSSASATLYVQLNGTKMWLVTIGTEQITGKTYTYAGAANKMFWSDEYSAYCYLVVADEVPAITGDKFAIVDGDAVEVSYDMNVNMTTDNVVDAADAQLAWNMYNVKYNGFTDNVTMMKYLKADVNGDSIVSTLDAQAIVNSILNLSAEQG